MKMCHFTPALSIPLLAALLSAGCVAVQTAKFDVSGEKVPSVPNSGDRYCVIRIDEERQLASDRGQSPPPVAKVQERLCAAQPQWFSSGEDAIPVIVHLRSSGVRINAGGMFFFQFLENIAGTITLGLIPYTFNQECMDFSTDFSCGNGRMAGNSSFTGTTIIKGGNPLTMNEATFPRGSGWKPIKPTDPKPRFDQHEERWLDAICASISLLVQRLTPEERKALRENNEAWWLDGRLGNKRKRPISIVHADPASAEPSTPALLESIHPKILSQKWNIETRTGSIVFSVSEKHMQAEAVDWLKDEYLPEYCRVLGTVVSADTPDATKDASIRITSLETLPDGSSRLGFSIDQ